jgi:hypothetical protein
MLSHRSPRISNETIMDIRFLPDAPDYRDANLTVEFAAIVDGRRVPCAISVEALEDHFGAQSYDTAGWIDQRYAGAPEKRTLSAGARHGLMR